MIVRHAYGVRMRTRVRTVVAVATTAAVAALLTGGAPGQAAPATATASSRTVTTQLSIAGGAGAWKPSTNARVTRVRAAGGSALQVRPKRAAGRKTISMRSPLSAAPVDRAGTVVRASARLRSSQPGRRLTLRIQEVSGGHVVASRSATVVPSSRGWRSVDVALRTTRPGSRIRLATQAKRVGGTHAVRLASIAVTQAVPTVPIVPTVPTVPTVPKVPVVPPPPVSAAACESIDYTDPAQGVRTFTENFDGTTLDPKRWRVRDNTFLNQDQAWITKDAVSVHDGYLDIAGKRMPESQWKTNKNALYGTENATRQYSTGYVDTIDDAAADRFSQRYGSFEVRAWVPSTNSMSRGIWPAFWLRADHQPGEIDPMESYGGPTIRSFDPSSSYEWNSWADTAQGSTTDANKQKTQGRADVGTDKIWQDWHVYGVTWSPTCLRYTYDGRTVGMVKFDDPLTKTYFRGPTFADTFHIRLNMQIGSKYWGWADPEHTRPEFSYKIDWVRVHQGKELLGR